MDVITLPLQGGVFTFRNPGRRRKRLTLGCYASAFQAGKCINSRGARNRAPTSLRLFGLLDIIV